MEHRLFKLLLVKLKVLRPVGRRNDDEYIVDGVYVWNPLTYVVVLISALCFGIYAFFDHFLYTWRVAFIKD